MQRQNLRMIAALRDLLRALNRLLSLDGVLVEAHGKTSVDERLRRSMQTSDQTSHSQIQGKSWLVSGHFQGNCQSARERLAAAKMAGRQNTFLPPMGHRWTPMRRRGVSHR